MILTLTFYLWTLIDDPDMPLLLVTTLLLAFLEDIMLIRLLAGLI